MKTSSSILAALLLEQLGIESKPDLEQIASEIGLRIKEVNSDGFEGALVQGAGAGKGIIAVNASISERSRKRFTIAHEIGHFIIPTHRTRANVCSHSEVESWWRDFDDPEVEANDFAAELLLPSRIVQERLKLPEPSFQEITRVAREFETSLTATTRRFIDLTDLACVMIWSQDGVARWYSRSEAFPFYIPLRGLPQRESKAGRLFRGESVSEEFSPTNPEHWLETTDAVSTELLLEHSLFLGNYNAVLTILWIEHAPQLEEESLLEERDPEEFTLGRKHWPR